jgi:hypothetical protein
MIYNLSALSITVLLLVTGVSGCSSSNQAAAPSICTTAKSDIQSIEDYASKGENPGGFFSGSLEYDIVSNTSLGYADADLTDGNQVDQSKTFAAAAVIFAPCLSSTAQDWLSSHE